MTITQHYRVARRENYQAGPYHLDVLDGEGWKVPDLLGTYDVPTTNNHNAFHPGCTEGHAPSLFACPTLRALNDIFPRFYNDELWTNREDHWAIYRLTLRPNNRAYRMTATRSHDQTIVPVADITNVELLTNPARSITRNRTKPVIPAGAFAFEYTDPRTGRAHRPGRFYPGSEQT